MIQSYIRVVSLERPIVPLYEAGPCPPSDGYWLPFEVGRGFLFEVSIVPFCDQQLVTTRGESLPQGGTLIFSYIRRLGPFFLVQNFEFRYFMGFQKNKYFWGMRILWIFFWGLHKIGIYLEVISMHFKSFFKVKVQNWGYFFGLLKFQIFFGVLEIPDIFWGEGQMLGPSLRTCMQ